MAQKDSMTPSLTELAKALVCFSTRSDRPPRKKLQFGTSTTNSSEGFSIKMGVHAGIPGGFTSPSVGPSFEKRNERTNTQDGQLISQNIITMRGNATPFGIGGTYEFTSENRHPQEDYQPKRLYSWMICLAHHLIITLVITYFILSIELTILWNGISGVHSIRNTGQLIPFIIGVVSTVNAVQQIILKAIQKAREKLNSCTHLLMAYVVQAYSDLRELDFEVSLGFESGHGLRLIKRTVPQPKIIRRGEIHWDRSVETTEQPAPAGPPDGIPST